MASPDTCQNVTPVRMGEHFCLKWNNHQENLTGIMTKLLDEQKFVDVSLVCEMKTFKAHQTVLTACSPYFELVLEENPHPHPIIILRDVKEAEMAALLQYMYRGEVNVRDDELSAFLHTARALQVRGLSDSKKDSSQQREELTHSSTTIPQSVTVNSSKRRRMSASTTESVVPERLHSDCMQQQQQQQPGQATVQQQSSAVKAAVNSSAVSNYSENSSDGPYSEPSSQPIKQELEQSSGHGDEHYVMGHHMPSEDKYEELQPTSVPPPATSCPETVRAAETDLQDGPKQRHIKYTYDKLDGERYKCKICGQIKKQARNHYFKHFPGHHECHLCRRTYTRKDNLNTHFKKVHSELVKSPSESCTRLKNSSKKLAEYQGASLAKYYAADVYKYSAAATATLNSQGPLPSQSSSLGAPMDLSVRPYSVPNPAPYSPIYNILHKSCINTSLFF